MNCDRSRPRNTTQQEKGITTDTWSNLDRSQRRCAQWRGGRQSQQVTYYLNPFTFLNEEITVRAEIMSCKEEGTSRGGVPAGYGCDHTGVA